MGSTKIKSIETRAKFDEAVDTVAKLQVAIAALKADRDRELQAVDEKYKGSLDALQDKRDLQLKLAEEYASENREELFPRGLKSVETTLATFGFRIGQPTLKPLAKRFK